VDGELLALLTLSAVAVTSTATAALGVRARIRCFPGQLYRVEAPPSAASAEAFFVSAHGLLRSPVERFVVGQPPIALELASRGGEVHLQLWVTDMDRDTVASLLRATYPGAVLVPMTTPDPLQSSFVAVGRLRLREHATLPIRSEFEAEPLAATVSTLASVADASQAALRIVASPRSDRWRAHARRRAELFRASAKHPVQSGGSALRVTVHERQVAAAIDRKSAGPGFDCAVSIVVEAASAPAGRDVARALRAALATYDALNGLALARPASGWRSRRLVDRRTLPAFGSTLLTAAELAALWHVPATALPRLAVAHASRLPPPRAAIGGARPLGRTTWADEGLPVGLSVADSRHHLHLLGPTGTGKTTVLLNLAAHDIAAGRGVAVLDPKGDLIDGLLGRIPPSRVNDVVLITPEGGGLHVGINPLEVGPSDDVDLIADNIVTIFRRIYESSWGMRTDDILKSAILTLLHRPDATLAQIPLLLTNETFRKRIVGAASDPLALDGFWLWFNKLSEYKRTDVIGPVLNKLRDFLLRPRLRRVLCQPRSTIDLRTVVDSGQILLADLSVGRWGDTTSALLGSFLVAKLWQAVLARSAHPEGERRDFFLFVDEFQHFLGISGPFGDALAEARSLRLSLTIANQHLGQLPRELRDAVSSNARSRGVFQCGTDDAAALAREFAPLDAATLLALPRYEMAVRLSIEGRTSEPFTVRTEPPATAADPAIASAVTAAALARYGRPGEELDAELRATLVGASASRTTPGVNRRA
jgi:hypothetical protein